MRLRKFRVRAFRCIHDSGEITVGDMAAFVGRNESGKTTILQALTLLNRDEGISDLDLCDEMSDELKSEMTLVEGNFEMTAAETAMIQERFPDIPPVKGVRLFRTNTNPDVQYDFGDVQIEEEDVQDAVSWDTLARDVRTFMDTIPNHLRERLDASFFEGQQPSTRQQFDEGMERFHKSVQAIVVREEQVMGEWLTIYKDPQNQFEKLLEGIGKRKALEKFIGAELHPRFVYFSDYKKIHGNINLNEFIREQKGERGGTIEFVEEFDKAETVRNLFYLAELDLDSLESFQDSPSNLIKILNAASNKLTKRLNPTWKGDPIHVDLRYSPGNIMSLVISDVHRDGTITNTGLLNRRAEGFKWTFSFIVNFAAETQRAELKEAILLLDEPARNLHPTQQMGIADLLKDLAGSNQVLYATHSPFMIFDYNPGNLLVVELDRRRHLSKIFYDYWNADDKTLTPILYGLSRGLVQSITDRSIGFNSRPVIIVETMSDAMYLNAFDKFLEDPNISMNPLNVVASHSKDAVLPLATFYRDHGYRTFVLLDDSAESRHTSSQLVRNGFAPAQTILYEREGKKLKSIEDYIVPSDYLHAVNQTYEVKLRQEGYRGLSESDLLGEDGMVDALRSIWSSHDSDGWGEFSNEDITRYICDKIAAGETDFLGETTKDSFRSLYRTIAERIRQYQERPPDFQTPGRGRN
ncbi:MAG: AAA family ATPase [Thaumarchaeota archaeon]|nr:AAA family ATPase [Nitrososphaerota archaeon]